MESPKIKSPIIKKKKSPKIYYLVKVGQREEGQSDEDYFYKYKLFSTLKSALNYCHYYIRKHDEKAPLGKILRKLSSFPLDSIEINDDDRRINLEKIELS